MQVHLVHPAFGCAPLLHNPALGQFTAAIRAILAVIRAILAVIRAILALRAILVLMTRGALHHHAFVIITAGLLTSIIIFASLPPLIALFAAAAVNLVEVEHLERHAPVHRSGLQRERLVECRPPPRRHMLGLGEASRPLGPLFAVVIKVADGAGWEGRACGAFPAEPKQVEAASWAVREQPSWPPGEASLLCPEEGPGV
eukprot:scaffold113751_cov34-Tisochrysis_lutea.AAC.5